MNELKYAIQDELILFRFSTVEESYQVALKEEEKLSKKLSTRRRKSTTQSKKFSSTIGKTNGVRKEEIHDE